MKPSTLLLSKKKNYKFKPSQLTSFHAIRLGSRVEARREERVAQKKQSNQRTYTPALRTVGGESDGIGV